MPFILYTQLLAYGLYDEPNVHKKIRTERTLIYKNRHQMQIFPYYFITTRQ